KVFNADHESVLTRPDEQFGDFSTNIALQLAGKLGKQPREVAQELVQALQKDLPDTQITIAGAGFINFTFSDNELLAVAAEASIKKPQTYKNKVVVAEYGDPNPFKILHAGHLYTDVVGDAVANLYETAGAKVHRVNFGGDVGLHVGRAMWAIIKYLGGENPEQLQDIPQANRASWMTDRYVEGNTAYEDDPIAKQEIIDCNKRVYQLHTTGDKTSPFAQIYWTCRQWSYDYFAYFYGRLNSHFEKYYPESENAGLGLQTVRDQLKKGVFQESDGAVVFAGEKYGLHTRVFITKLGLPTYEAKDVGLVMAKWQDYHFDVSLIITSHDQAEYMKVVVKSIEQFMPELAKRTVHLTHGIVKLAGGVKMSSRKGNFLRATDILDAAAEANKKARGTEDPQTTIAAVKYGFLKNRIGGDTVYDPVESVNLEGNSGPYLQYAHARARSILAKSSVALANPAGIEPGERSLVRKISQYPEVVALAVAELAPHHICTYLYELAQIFNRFYEQNRVLGDPREAERLYFVTLYASILKDGLSILNIAAPERI
ncbi:MAG TPA: arginine--tRNA ligase, partial [Candidatus Saccharimonadales bacterium]|nr:arginine--tRNA ligase [Candidatus Saccharimonadales bacterium]